MVSSKNLARALYRLSKDEMLDSQEVFSAFLAYIERYNLLPLLPKVLRHLDDFNKKDEAFNSLHITSGLPIDEKLVDNIRSLVSEGKESEISLHTDRELIAGFIATYRGRIYDASMRNQLQLLRKKLTNA